MKQQKTLEKYVVNACLQYLQLKDIFHYRSNSGAMVSEYKGKKRFMRFGAKGSPDIVAVVRGQYWGIECKSSSGKISEDQLVFAAALERAGGRYLVCRSVEDLMKAGL